MLCFVPSIVRSCKNNTYSLLIVRLQVWILYLPDSRWGSRDPHQQWLDNRHGAHPSWAERSPCREASPEDHFSWHPEGLRNPDHGNRLKENIKLLIWLGTCNGLSIIFLHFLDIAFRLLWNEDKQLNECQPMSGTSFILLLSKTRREPVNPALLSSILSSLA